MTATSRHTDSCPPLCCSAWGCRLPGPAILSQHLPGNQLRLKAMKANLWSSELDFTGLHQDTPLQFSSHMLERQGSSPSKPEAARRSRHKAIGIICNWCLKCKFPLGWPTSSTHNCCLLTSSYQDFHPSDSLSPLGSFSHVWVFYDTQTKRCCISNNTHLLSTSNFKIFQHWLTTHNITGKGVLRSAAGKALLR